MIEYILSKLQYLFMIFVVLFLCAFPLTNLFAENNIPLSFNELNSQNHELIAKKWDRQPVAIRGFLYSTSDGFWILSPEPTIKSCCLGTVEKAHQQIAIEFNTTPPTSASHQPVTLEGLFFFTPRSYDKSPKIPLYQLKQARIATETSTPFLWILVVLGIFAVLSWGFSLKKT
jgi:hypothetical protein